MRQLKLALCVCVAVLGAGCSDDNGRTIGSGDGGNSADDGGGTDDLGYDRDAFFETDPPAKMCALDGGMFTTQPTPGGTPDCPDDKNRAGCPCPTAGMQAPCWPGLRANRNLGICKDGVTTCMQRGEFDTAWGECDGYVLPTPGATDGPGACVCFSHGTWALTNTSPCFISGGGPGSGGAVSTTGTPPACPADATMAPAGNWSDDTVTADCAGRFKLCYTIKAGDVMNPKPTDCTLISVCSQGDYTQVNMAQSFPPLPSWLASSSAQSSCATQFNSVGGYGEMSVDGMTVDCTAVDRVFNRIGYCPASCNTTPTTPMCMMCGTGGSGTF